MNRNRFFNQNTILAGICLVLCVAIVLGLLPAGNMIQAQPEDPLNDADIQDITALQMGEELSELNTIVVPNGGSAMPSEPKETEPEETKPEETKPREEPSTEIDPEEQEKGDEDEGNDDGLQGEQGGELQDLDLAAVLTWYKYGNEPNTLACGPSASVAKSINIAQLPGNKLKYDIALTGEDAGYVHITGVSLAEGDAAFRETSRSGSVEIRLPEGTGSRNYTFLLDAVIEKNGSKTELTFLFVLKCAQDPDLELKMRWQPQGGNPRDVVCGPDRTEAFSVYNYDLIERVFGYSVELTGKLSADARIVSATYTTASGQKAGELAADGGNLILDPAAGSNGETYYLLFTVQSAMGEIQYRFKLMYKEMLDVQLVFHWQERGSVQRTKLCEPEESAIVRIKSNQLSAGAIPYELRLSGRDGEEGKILSAAYTCEAGNSGNLETAGSLPLTMAPGASSNLYRITVNALVKGQRIRFEILVQYTADVTLVMEYTVLENGVAATRQLTCENARTRTAEAVYDDQLAEGLLQYTMTLQGGETGDMQISSISCYQSGSGRTLLLGAQGQVTLLLKDGKTGENTFDIEARDSSGNTYRFKVNIPYKHRGENTIRIETNLTDGQDIINETKTNLSVRAWSEDAGGKVISYIPANGVDTILKVTLDGQELSYVSSSGAASEYDLYPSNPEIGDTNDHVLYIYAEDALGNYGELTLNLVGQRREPGQNTGKATIYVDLTVLGLGIVAELEYDVLADEPVSYVIAKAVLGWDAGEPFGKATEILGWNGRYAGTPDLGFYLQSLSTGYNANALEDSRWPGKTETEILEAIDRRFGAGTGLATLWRCLYRNGLNKSSGTPGSFGEFDYTSGSGWMYSVGGATYYPGQSMSGVYLQDGDVLTLRYTLAYGWDVGGGTAGYGSTVGYCVSAVNGNIRVNHRLDPVTGPDGAVSYVCHCCGAVQECAHPNMTCTDLGDGMHIQYCADCKKEVGDPEEHIWSASGNDQDHQHSCAECGAAEAHVWKEIEGSNTATCTEPGIRSVQCRICDRVLEEEAGPKGHTLDNKWQYDAKHHYEVCSTCGEEANHGSHQYAYISGKGWEDFACSICNALHSDDGDTCDGKLHEVEATCSRIVYSCDKCGSRLIREDSFQDRHSYADGQCIHCGKTQ